MDIFEAIYTRRSIRKYQERQIPLGDLKKSWKRVLSRPMPEEGSAR